MYIGPKYYESLKLSPSRKESITGVYEPCPTDNRKSFYGKCYVLKFADGSELLISYQAPVLGRDKNGNFARFWDGYSATTTRHICATFSLPTGDFKSRKEQVKSIPLTNLETW